MILAESHFKFNIGQDRSMWGSQTANLEQSFVRNPLGSLLELNASIQVLYIKHIPVKVPQRPKVPKGGKGHLFNRTASKKAIFFLLHMRSPADSIQWKLSIRHPLDLASPLVYLSADLHLSSEW